MCETDEVQTHAVCSRRVWHERYVLVDGADVAHAGQAREDSGVKGDQGFDRALDLSALDAWRVDVKRGPARVSLQELAQPRTAAWLETLVRIQHENPVAGC